MSRPRSLRLAAMLAGVALLITPTSRAFGAERPSAGSVTAVRRAVDVKALKPRVVWKRIPYGHHRRRQMAAYSRRHYGAWSWHLKAKVIVEHYTDGTSFSSAWNTFAANSKHNGEYPGTCAHFIIDTDGTIYQLVDLAVRCRHVVGMNYVAIGIEHVGTSDAQVLGNRRQMRSSLRLTAYLMARFGINVGNVIGHAEALESPYHYDLYPGWRCLVHADFPHPAMKKYRHRLRDVASAEGVRLGAGPKWVAPGC